jgi:dihydrofolate synthase/folylpolyglutamate synthase
VITPELTIITNISLEHREYPGKPSQIAFEKAGIIKRRCPVVTGVRQPSAFAVLSETARRKSAPVYRLGDAFSFRRKGPGAFTYRGIHRVWPGMVTGLLGDYQVENAAVVLAACELLLHKAPRISLDSVRAGLLAHRWPGRLRSYPRCHSSCSTAHNLDAAKQLARHVRKHFTGRDITVVVGILDDKPYAAMLRLLPPMASAWSSPRPESTVRCRRKRSKRWRKAGRRRQDHPGCRRSRYAWSQPRL